MKGHLFHNLIVSVGVKKTENTNTQYQAHIKTMQNVIHWVAHVA